MHWFEEWFDSPLYDILYADRNEEEAAQLVQLISRILPPEKYPHLLDLGCGRGRHSLVLAEKGYQMTGIDLAEEAIRIAKVKAEERELDNVEFLVSDMRHPLDQQFDAILNLFTSFGYFKSDSENREVFGSVNEMLHSDGIFFMDYMNAEWVYNNFRPEDEGEFRDIHYQIRRYVEEDIIYKEIRFDGDGVEEPLSYTEQVKLYDLEWFMETFDTIGFEIEQVFGDYSGEAFHPHSSTRLVMVVRKQ